MTHYELHFTHFVFAHLHKLRNVHYCTIIIRIVKFMKLCKHKLNDNIIKMKKNSKMFIFQMEWYIFSKNKMSFYHTSSM